MKDSDYRARIDNIPQMVGVFKIVRVPEGLEESLYYGDVIYGDGDYFHLSMHDCETADPSKIRKPLLWKGLGREVPVREADLFEYLEPEHLEFVEYDYL